MYAVALYVEAEPAANELGIRNRGGFFQDNRYLDVFLVLLHCWYHGAQHVMSPLHFHECAACQRQVIVDHSCDWHYCLYTCICLKRQRTIYHVKTAACHCEDAPYSLHMKY